MASLPEGSSFANCKMKQSSISHPWPDSLA